MKKPEKKQLRHKGKQKRKIIIRDKVATENSVSERQKCFVMSKYYGVLERTDWDTMNGIPVDNEIKNS